MNAKQATVNATEQREKRAKSIAAMGLVTREGAGFKVTSPSLRGRQNAYEVWRDEKGKVRCSCLEFEEMTASEPNFRCEHILAVKYAVLAKNTEAVTQKVSPKSKVRSPKSEAVDAPTRQHADAERKTESGQDTQNATESSAIREAETGDAKIGRQEEKDKGQNSEIAEQKSAGRHPQSAIEPSSLGEQQSNYVKPEVLVQGQIEAMPNLPKSTAKVEGKFPQKVEQNSLADIQDERKNTMLNTVTNRKNVKEMPFVTAEEFAAGEFQDGESGEQPANQVSNVVNVDFTRTLQALKTNVSPEMVKKREGWVDSKGNTHLVDYVEWHTVADILDRVTPNWSHSIRDIKQIGAFVAVTAAITINGVTREGVGTGAADTETGIKKAEHDALKRAAVKFGIARELYQRESEIIERDGSTVPPTNGGFPANPIARSIADLLTSKQLGMIRAISRDLNVDSDTECQNVMKCKTDELSKRAASSFIQHLQTLQNEAITSGNREMRRAG